MAMDDAAVARCSRHLVRLIQLACGLVTAVNRVRDERRLTAITAALNVQRGPGLLAHQFTVQLLARLARSDQDHGRGTLLPPSPRIHAAERDRGAIEAFQRLGYLGSLDQGLTYSLHALLLCNDLAGLLRTMWQGVQIDDDSLALDLARTVGPRGNYLAQPHTVAHCREHLWQSRYFGPNMPLSSAGGPDTDLYARIDRDLRQLLQSHRPPPLERELEARLRGIRQRFEASHPCSSPR